MRARLVRQRVRASDRATKAIRLIVGVAVAALALGSLARAASAQTETERVVELVADITVNPDGSAEFVERIGYSFGEKMRHGILRDIVTAQRYDDERDRHYPLTVYGVTSPDSPSQYVVEDAGGGVERVRIGDPDTEITGRHNYELRYRLDGVVNAQDGPDELYWNVTGHDWSVPIDTVSVTVTVPGGAEKIDCFAGPKGATTRCAHASIDAGVARFGHGYLPPGHGLTVVVAIPDVNGAEIEPQPILGERRTSDPFSWSEAFEVNPFTVAVTGAMTAALAGLIAVAQFRVGRDRRAIGAPTDIAFAQDATADEPVPLFSGDDNPVEFVPPDGIRPAQLGLLHDEVVHTRDVTATIIDLAVRGYLRIEEITDDDGDVDDYRFVRLSKNGGLLPYEEHLLRKLFETGPVVELSSLKNKFAKHLQEVTKRIYADAVERGWFTRRPDHVRVLWLALGMGVTTVGAIVTFLLATNTSLGLLGLPLILAGIVLSVGSKWMPRRTALGHGVYKRILGFEEFIEHSEKHRAEWAERRHLFTEYLPYAIAFGATKKWARTLESLGAPPPQSSGNWYVGHHAYSWGAFGDRMNKFSSSTSTTLSSTPGGSGSSGFSGGSSGGGGGGGGGGSW